MGKIGYNILLWALVVVLLFLSVFTFFPTSIKYNNGTRLYNSPLVWLSTGDDLGKGMYARFKVLADTSMTNDEFMDAVAEVAGIMRDRLEYFNVPDVVITYSAKEIVVRCSYYSLNTQEPAARDASFLSLLEPYGDFSIAMLSTDGKPGAPIVTKADIKDIVITKRADISEDTPWVYYFLFNKQATQKLKEITSTATTANSVKLSLTMPPSATTSTQEFKQVYDDGMIGYMAQTREQVDVQRCYLLNGTYRVGVTMEESALISANNRDTGLVVFFVMIAVLLIYIIAMSVTYGFNGLSYGISLIVCVLLTIWTSAGIYGSVINMPTLYAVLVNIVVFALFSALKCSKAKLLGEALGDMNATAKLDAVIRKANAAYNMTLIKVSCLSIIMAIATWLLAVGTMRGFGVVMTYSIVLTLVCLMFVARLVNRILRNALGTPASYKLTQNDKEVQ
ncbi:MAG: hypothetical protein PHW00_05765 [Clostridia bacterium]|nr:hypothetical protein [Clostridia bacterium]